MPRKKYILLDTNIYVHFCFFDLDLEDGIKTIESLKRILDRNEAILLLPEVVELEFEKDSSVKRKRLAKRLRKIYFAYRRKEREAKRISH